MQKNFLLFEPDELLRNTWLEQISINRDLHVKAVSTFEDLQSQLKKSSFDLIIMGSDREIYCFSSIRRFIKEAEISNAVLFITEAETRSSHLKKI